jgi:hypothetical protein
MVKIPRPADRHGPMVFRQADDHFTVALRGVPNLHRSTRLREGAVRRHGHRNKDSGQGNGGNKIFGIEICFHVLSPLPFPTAAWRIKGHPFLVVPKW